MSSYLSSRQLALAPGSVVVFEGLDKAGKSTQLDRMKQVIDPAHTTFAHMPSGFTEFTAAIYAVLEDGSTTPTDPLARQLTHLACHRESMHTLVEKSRSELWFSIAGGGRRWPTAGTDAAIVISGSTSTRFETSSKRSGHLSKPTPCSSSCTPTKPTATTSTASRWDTRPSRIRARRTSSGSPR